MPYLPAVWVAYPHRIMNVSGSYLGRVTGCLGKSLVVVSPGRVQKFGMVRTVWPLSPSKGFSAHWLRIAQWICVSLIGLPPGYVVEGVGTFVRLRKMPVHVVSAAAPGIALVPRASCPINTGTSFTGCVQASSPLSSIVVEDPWSYTSSLLYVFTTPCLIKNL